MRMRVHYEREKSSGKSSRSSNPMRFLGKGNSSMCLLALAIHPQIPVKPHIPSNCYPPCYPRAKRTYSRSHKSLFLLVGTRGFEPPTPCSQIGSVNYKPLFYNNLRRRSLRIVSINAYQCPSVCHKSDTVKMEGEGGNSPAVCT